MSGAGTNVRTLFMYLRDLHYAYYSMKQMDGMIQPFAAPPPSSSLLKGTRGAAEYSSQTLGCLKSCAYGCAEHVCSGQDT